jgi:hypothetical protein
LASDLGDAIGTALTIVVGGDLGGAVDVLRGAETVEEAEATADVEQSINEGNYIVKTSEGTYVGQSGDISSRLAAHVANDKFTQAEVDVAERIFVGGGKTAREIAEQRLIDGLGGVDSPDVLNIRNPIGQTRIGLMGPGYIRP